MKQDPKYLQNLREQILKLVHQVSSSHSNANLIDSAFFRLEIATIRSRIAFCSELWSSLTTLSAPLCLKTRTACSCVILSQQFTWRWKWRIGQRKCHSSNFWRMSARSLHSSHSKDYWTKVAWTKTHSLGGQMTFTPRLRKRCFQTLFAGRLTSSLLLRLYICSLAVSNSRSSRCSLVSKGFFLRFLSLNRLWKRLYIDPM